MDGKPARWWHRAPDGRVQCDLCPRHCRLKPGQRGFCFVRRATGDGLLLDTWGRSSGFCIDPIEKKPLNHFYPGSAVLSFGTAGCNLACRFCQNWSISRARQVDRLQDRALPEEIARRARDEGCTSVAFTYNEPIIFAEYALDTAAACHELGIETVAVTAGYMTEAAREDFFRGMDAANIDLKAFSDDFYRRWCSARLGPVLDTIRYAVLEAETWVELTTLLIPGANDSDREIDQLTSWVARELGPDVPLHFTAFHPSWRVHDRPPTPPSTLRRARAIARANGLRYVYTGNVRDLEGATTTCPSCGEPLVVRDGYRILHYALDGDRCPRCGTRIAGRFSEEAGSWGPRRKPLRFW